MDQETGHTAAPRDGALRAVVWGGAALLWALPWVAMRFTAEVAWDALDFAVFGAMLALAAGACDLALRASRQWKYRLAFAVAVGTAFVSLWANLAVGTIGAPPHPANLLFAGVLLFAVGGAIGARLQARGMAVAMRAAALAQAIATALAVWWTGWDPGVLPALAFALGWLLSSLLFRRAARDAITAAH
jgi:hypothetical protein